MAIPIADLQKQIQTPEAAQGQALDLSENVKAAFSPALNTLDNMEKFTNVWAKAAYVQERSEDQFKAEQASLKYMEKANELNKQLATKQGVDALKFKDKYYSELTKAQEVFLGELTSLKHADIRENARDGINKFNLSNSANQEMYFYKQDELVKDDTSEAVKNTAMNAALSAVSPFLKAEENISAFNSALQAGADSLANRLIAKGTPKELIALQVQQYRAKAAKLAAERLAADSRNFGFLTGYKSSLDFLNSLGTEIDTQDKITLLKEFEQKQLDYEFKRKPERFKKSDDTYNEELAAIIAPNLTPYERLKTLQISDKGKKDGLSAEGTKVATKIADLHVENFFDSLVAIGAVPQGEIAEMKAQLLSAGGDDAREAFAKNLVDNFKTKGTLAATIKLLNSYKHLSKAQYIINTETGKEIDTTGMSEEEIDALKNQGKTEIVNDIFAYASDLSKGAYDLERIIKPVIKQMVRAYEGESGIKPGFWKGRKLTVEEQAALSSVKQMYELSGRDYNKIPYNVVIDTHSYFLDNFSRYMQEERDDGKGNKIIKSFVNLELDAVDLWNDNKKRKFVGQEKKMTYADRLKQLQAEALNNNLPKNLRQPSYNVLENWGPQEFDQMNLLNQGIQSINKFISGGYAVGDINGFTNLFMPQPSITFEREISEEQSPFFYLFEENK